MHPVLRWMGATLDGLIAGSGAVFEAKFMLPWSFSEQAAAEKHMPQLQHNMWVTNARNEVLSIITGGVAPIPCISTSSWRRKRNLALCTERRDPLLIRRRTAAPSYRGSSHCRYERLEFLRCIACCDMKVSRKREGR